MPIQAAAPTRPTAEHSVSRTQWLFNKAEAVPPTISLAAAKEIIAAVPTGAARTLQAVRNVLILTPPVM